jgi:hypothetical protein
MPHHSSPRALPPGFPPAVRPAFPLNAVAAVMVLSGLSCALPAQAAAGDPVGDRLTVHQGGPRHAQVASDPAGDFVVAWEDDASNEVGAQRYDAAGNPLGAPLTVAAVATGAIGGPALAMAADGGFAVAWTVLPDTSLQGGGTVYVRRYGADGAALGDAVAVSGDLPVGYPQLAMDPDGDYVVGWSGNSYDWNGRPPTDYRLHPGLIYVTAGVYARPFHADGTPASDTVSVAQRNGTIIVLGGTVYDPKLIPLGVHQFHGGSVAMDADGDFVSSWIDVAPYQANDRVRYRRFDATGAPRGWTGTAYRGDGDPQDVAVQSDAAGNFVLIWTQGLQTQPAALPAGVYGRSFGAGGRPLATAFPVSDTDSGTPFGPALGMDGSGNFVASWSTIGTGSDSAQVHLRRFAAGGTAQGPSVIPYTGLTGSQANSDVAIDADGDFVVTWSSYGVLPTSVYAQRYQGPVVSP